MSKSIEEIEDDLAYLHQEADGLDYPTANVVEGLVRSMNDLLDLLRETEKETK